MTTQGVLHFSADNHTRSFAETRPAGLLSQRERNEVREKSWNTPWRSHTERGCVADQPQHLHFIGLLRLVEDDTAALRCPTVHR